LRYVVKYLYANSLAIVNGKTAIWALELWISLTAIGTSLHNFRRIRELPEVQVRIDC